MTTVETPPESPAEPQPAHRPTATDCLSLAVAEVTVVAMAVLRWTGEKPYGSDNDEYRMLADSLWDTGRPLIGGVEGTKYPFGWSLLIGALDRVGLDVTTAAMALNLLFVAGTVAVVWAVTRRWGAVASGAAALAVALGASLWSAVYVVMPDAALTFVVALGLWWMATLDDARRTRVLQAVALAAAAVLLKTVGIVLAGALTVAMFLRPQLRRWSWAPVATGLALTGVQSVALSRYPEHTTGYGATFWLRDPYDAAAGRISATDLPGRIAERMDVFWTDAGTAALGVDVPSGIGIWATIALIAAALVAYRRVGVPALAFVLVYAVLLAAWPYRSFRFGLPLVPLAAAGFAGLLGMIRARAGAIVAGGVAIALLGPYAVSNVGQIQDDATAESAALASLNAASDELVAWADENIAPNEPIASLDYRELGYRMDREILPLSYTTDTEALLEASAGRGARWLIVVRGLYGRREARADALLSAYPERFDLVHRNDRTDVYRIDTVESTP